MMNSPAVANGTDRIGRIMSLIPGAVLFPAPEKFKGCNVPGWGEMPSSVMEDERWLERVKASPNIAVRLGHDSNGICSIDIDNDEEVEPFLSLNPVLRESLRTKGARGCNIWVRMTDDGYPHVTNIVTAAGDKWGEWRATGGLTMIAGIHKNGSDRYRAVKNAPAVEISFSDIAWPEDLRMDWNWPDVAGDQSETAVDEDESLFAAVVERCGNPVFTTDKGKVCGINEPFWAGLMAAENIIIHEPEERQFYRYDHTTGLFQPETPEALKSETARRMLLESRANPALAVLESFRSDRQLGGIVAHLRGQTEERGAFLPSERNHVHLANGVLVINGDECRLEPFSPEFRSRNRSPIPYDPAATCPRFLDELVFPAVAPEDVAVLQKMAGQALLGQNIVQRFTILDGLEGRGKTQFANVIQRITGMANVCQLRTKLLGERFELYRLLRKTLLVGVDVDADFLATRGAAVIKALCGGDWLDAEQKGGNGCHQFQGIFNILMTSNARLKVKLQGDIGAWRRRLLIVRYEAPPPKRRIPDFGLLLVNEEGSGILNWALRGLGALLEDVRECGDIRLSERQKMIVDSLLAESDSLRHFLKRSLIESDGWDLTVDEIVRAYAQFCPDMGWSALPETEIQRQLPSLMLELFKAVKAHDIKRDGRSVRGFRGVVIKPEVEP